MIPRPASCQCIYLFLFHGLLRSPLFRLIFLLFFFFSSSPRHVSPRIVVRGSWMPDDYIDRVGGWSEASKVAANFAIRRNTTSTKKYLLLGRGSRPLIPFSPENHAKFSLSPRVISPAWIFLCLLSLLREKLRIILYSFPHGISLEKSALESMDQHILDIHFLNSLYINDLNISEVKYFLFE